MNFIFVTKLNVSVKIVLEKNKKGINMVVEILDWLCKETYENINFQ